MFNSNGLSPADVVAMSNNDGFGNGSWLWFLIVIFALFGGFGGNGWGGNAGANDNYVLASDFATLQRQLDSSTTRLSTQSNEIANGLASLGYDQLSQMNGINTNILTSANGIQNAIQNCCCTNREGMANLNYNLATQANGINNAITSGFCQTNFNAQNNTRDIVDSNNAGTQAILAKLGQMESNAQQDKIATLTAENQRLAFAQSQQAQNAYLISRLQPTPVPSFPASNLYGYYGTTIG